MKNCAHLIFTFLLVLAVSAQAQARGRTSVTNSRRAIYLVPVIESLTLYSLFTRVTAEVKLLEDGRIKLEYIVPTELTGIENKIEFEGSVNEHGQLILADDYGSSAVCDGGIHVGRCQIKYSTLSFNPELRTQILQQISGSDSKALADREAVAAIFENLVLGRSLRLQFQSFSFLSNTELHGILEIL